MQCEICGQETFSARKIKFEGNELLVCEGCKGYGVEIERPFIAATKKFVSRENFAESKPEMVETILVEGFGEKIRKKREEKGLTLKEVGQKLFERESVIQKIEQEKFYPDEKLIKKLENFFGLKLTREFKAEKVEHEVSSEPMTLADLLEKKMQGKQQR